LDENNNFDTNFKSFLNPENPELNPNLELKIKIKRKEMFNKANYEFIKKKVFIRGEEIESIDKLTYYPLFSTIDFISKHTIIEEINPKKFIIFLGSQKEIINESDEVYNGNSKKNYKKLFNYLKEKKNNIIFLNNKIIDKETNSLNNKYFLKFDNEILNVKFDSSILQKLNFSLVKDYGNVYDLKNSFLRIKTKRNQPNIKEISLIYQDDIYLDQEKIKNHIILNNEQSDEKEELDFIYNKNQLKLNEIKKEISKLFNEDIIIFGDYLSNKNKDFKLVIRNGDIILEGNYNAAYLKVRKFIQDYMSSDNFSN